MMGIDISTIHTVEDLNGKNTSDLARIARETDKIPLLEGLIEHDSELVRGALCENPHLPASLIQRLKEDASDHVRIKAANLPDSSVGNVVSLVRDRVGNN